MLVMTTFISTVPFDLVWEAERKSIVCHWESKRDGKKSEGGKYYLSFSTPAQFITVERHLAEDRNGKAVNLVGATRVNMSFRSLIELLGLIINHIFNLPIL